MSDELYTFYDLATKDNSVKLLVQCTCNLCGKTILSPITRFGRALAYRRSNQKLVNNPYISAYHPDDWHEFDEPIGLLCGECIKNITERKPNQQHGLDYRPKDKDGFPIEFGRWYYCDGISGTCRVIEIVAGASITIAHGNPLRGEYLKTDGIDPHRLRRVSNASASEEGE